jgi:hypothetical protein
MKPDRPVFVLRLRPEHGIDPIHSLRHALKDLLRRYGMRAISVEQTTTEEGGRATGA